MPELEAVGYDPFKSKATPEDFAARYGSAAEKAGKALGVDPSILLGQWGLETGWGKSVIPGTNNLGNIKDFSGSGVAATDNMTGSRDKYRQYATPDAFADDFVSLIQRKYPNAVGAGADASKFTAGLKGYAEDPRYPDKVAQSARMASNRKGPIAQTLDKVTDAVMPSAQAATLEPVNGPSLEAVDFDPFAKPKEKGVGERIASGFAQGTKDLAGGLIRGAGSIGATLLAPGDALQDAIAGRPLMTTNKERRQGIDAGLQTLIGANPDSFAYGAGKLTGEIAGTAGVGNVLGAGAKAAGAGPQVVNALRSGGMTLGGPAPVGVAQTVNQLALRGGAGAATGAVSAGMVNPEDAKGGAMIGAALPLAAAAIAPVGKAIGNKLASDFADKSAAFSRGAERNRTLQEGLSAGYVVPPSSVDPSLRNTIKESISGKIPTAQVASNRNQEVTDKLVRKALGLADDAPLSAEALSKYRADLHAAGYEPLRQIGMVKADAKFGADLADVVNQYTGKGTIPATQKKEIADLVAAHKSTGFDAGDAVDAIRVLRDDAKDAFRKGDSALGKAQKAIADAYEGALERSLPAGSPLLNNYQAARQNIAKSFTVEDALKEGAGEVDARKLGAALQKGVPLSGDLLTAARFASAFPKATQPPSVVAGPGVHNLKAMFASGAGAAGGAVGALVGGPVGAAVGSALGAGGAFVVPAAMRAQMFSQGAQNRLIQQAPQANRLLQYSGNPELNQLLTRAAPVIGTSGNQ